MPYNDLEAIKELLSNGASGGSGTLILSFTENDGAFTCNKSWQEIHDAFMQGTRIICIEELEVEGIVGKMMYPLYAVVPGNGNGGKYEIVFFNSQLGDSWSAECDSSDEYPSYED